MRHDSPFRPKAERLEDRDVPTALGVFAVGGGAGGPPRIKVYETLTGNVVGDFLAYEPTFTGGVTTAVGDVNNDGFADVIVGAGVGGGPRVRVFDGRAFRTSLVGFVHAPTDGTSFLNDTAVVADFFAFESTQRGGSFVTAGNFAGSSFADVVVGAGPGGGPRVRILDGAAITSQARAFSADRPGDQVANFFAFESSFRNGVVVSANPTIFGGSFSDLVVTPGTGGGPRVRVLDGVQIAVQGNQFSSFGTNDTIADFFAADPASRTGLFVTTSDFNGDGSADVAVGTGPGLPGQVNIYDGASIRRQRGTFSGGRPGDLLSSVTVAPGYTNGVTVGSALASGTINTGLLLIGGGGQGRPGAVTVTRFVTGVASLTQQTVYDLTFDPNFVGGVFVSN